MQKIRWAAALVLATAGLGCKGEANKVYKLVLEVTTDVETLDRAAQCERIPELKKKLDDARTEAEKGSKDDKLIELATKHQQEAVDEAKAACDKDGKPTTTPNEEAKMVARTMAMSVLPSAMELYRKGELGDPSACYESMKKLLASEDEESRKSRCEILKADPPKERAARWVTKLALGREQLDWLDENKEKLAKKAAKKLKEKDAEEEEEDKKDEAKDSLEREFLSDWKSANCGDAKKEVSFKLQSSRARLAASVCLPHGGRVSAKEKD